jgi:Txe/YoeB family toxin of toxin-antitoxin system
MYQIFFSKQAAKDEKIIIRSKYRDIVTKLLDLIEENPYQTPPPVKKMVGNLDYAYSRRINRNHRLVYEVDEQHKRIRILSMWSHYENLH